MTILVAIFSPNAAWTLPRRFLDVLRAGFPEHTFVEAWTDADVARLLPDVDVAFTAVIERGQLASAPRLRWIQSSAAGVGGLLSTELAATRIVLTSARGIRAAAMAEHVIAVSLALLRQLPAAVRFQADRVWALDDLEGRIRTLHGRQMTIIGLGAIGQAVARLAVPLGVRVSAVRKRLELPHPDGVETVVSPDRLLDLLGHTDIIVLSAPLTGETRQLIDSRALDATRRGALLVNVGRGKLVDDEAVIAALQDGRLGGAALDVFTREPLDPDSPYWSLPNVLITPHVSGAMEDYWTPLVALFADNLRRFAAGQPLRNVVDKETGY
jgi:phosphoglycerate dehydrogenase-like enzyme